MGSIDNKIDADAAVPTDPTPPAPTGDGGGRQAKAPRGQDMGQALRSVYQRTVEESVPDEMLDLLGKLG